MVDLSPRPCEHCGHPMHPTKCPVPECGCVCPRCPHRTHWPDYCRVGICQCEPPTLPASAWARWPWQRCRAVREHRGRHQHHGRCELRRGHRGLHALERGMDTHRWSTDWAGW